MTPEQLTRTLKQRFARLEGYLKNTAPRLAGDIAINHIREDFARGGLTHNGFREWAKTRRQQSGGKDAGSQYGPLLSKRGNYLMHSIDKRVGEGEVAVYTEVPYAAIHNRGGTLHPKVTPKMRKFAWAMYYEEMGITRKMKRGDKARKTRQANESEAAKNWKRLALTRKMQLNIRIPQRQFMPSTAGPELTKKINARLDADVKKIMGT